MPAAAVNARIWHLFEQRDTRRFTLFDDAGGLFRIDPGNGEVSFARTATADDFATHELTLILRGGNPELTARQSARIRIRELPFRYIDDEDNEDKGEGTPADPFLIYDVYQLQAINGELPNEAVAELTLALNMTADAVISLAATVFGTTTIERLSRHYRLAVDIDAAVARGWNDGAGFAPIGGMDDFTGGFDGDGYAIRDLRISVDGDYAGLFTGIGAAATISDLLLQEIDVSGGGNVGALAGRLSVGLISRVGAYGRVVGATVGGLAGVAEGGTVSQSWFAGEVVAGGNGGGLFGYISVAVEVDRVWTAARVSAANQAGGLSPNFIGRITGSWAAGEIQGGFGLVGGMVDGMGMGSHATMSYWGVDTTGATRSELGISIARVEQVTVLGSGWNVGGREDFPVLTVLSESPQKLGAAYGLTRLQAVNVDMSIRDLSRFGVNEGGEEFSVMRLDLDGAADGRGVVCESGEGAVELRANPGYNDLRVVVSLVGGGVIQQYDDSACLFGVSAAAGGRTLRLRYESAAGAALVVDYALSLTVALTVTPPAAGPVISFVDAVLGEEIVVPSDATMDYPALTVNVEGINPTLMLLRGGSLALSDSRSPAILLLTTSAMSLFASDGLRVTAELWASDLLGRRTQVAAVFRSAPLGRNGNTNGMPTDIFLSQEQVVGGAVVLPVSDIEIEIWHYAGVTTFSLTTDAPDIFTVDIDDGRVRLRGSVDSSAYGNYALTLVGEGGGARGEQVLAVGLGRLPFIYNSGQKGSGVEGDPFQIFDIYQLQAIAGTLSSEAAAQIAMSVRMSEAVLQSLAATVFGDTASVRLSAHYRLMNDIDAARTREWSSVGFAPIGGDSTDDFTGVFDGNGRVVSGLFIDRLDGNRVGLFAGVDGGIVASVGLEQAHVTGGSNVGALVGVLSGDGRVVSVRVLGGRVVGSGASDIGGIGGLVGRADQSRVAASWSSAEVFGMLVPVGGLIGWQDDSSTVVGAWSSGRVESLNHHGGGLIGLREGGQVEESWSLSEVTAIDSSFLAGGLVGHRPISVPAATNGYWSVETSGLTESGDGIGVDTLQTLTVRHLPSPYWNFGGTSDFPLLVDLPAEQAIGIGRGMLRLRSVDGDEISAFGDISAISDVNYINEIGERDSLLRLDLNGAAENIAGQGRTSTSECIFTDGGELRADAGYNDVDVRLQVEAGDAEFLLIGDSASVCVIGLSASSGERGVLRAIVSSGGFNLTVDYPFSVTADISPPSVGEAAPPQIEADFPDAVAAIESGAPAGDFRYFRAGPSTVAANYRNTDLTVRDGFRAVDLFSSHPGFELSPNRTSVTEAGTAASLRLARPAADIFAADNQVVTVTIGATDVLGRSDSTVARFRSTPRAFDGAIVSFFFNYDENLSLGVTLLPAVDVSMTAWHLFGAPLRFTVAGDGATLFTADPESGGVAFARDILSADFGLYSLTLLLSGVSDGGFSVTVRKPLRVFLGLEPGRYGGRDKGTGTAEDPYLIYDVYQLQAIDSVYPSEAAAELATVWGVNVLAASMEINTLFGAGNAPLLSHYRLVNDIDATPTRGWGATGFSPIGGADTINDENLRFRGLFDGAGFVIKGLYVRSSRDGGLFAGIHTSATVRNLGLAEVDVGARVAGAISGRSFGLIENSWAIGRVTSNILAGGLIGTGDSDDTNLISLSWFAGDVEFDSTVIPNGVGGLIGRIGSGSGGARVFSSWAMARVRNFGGGRAGGIIGQQSAGGGISNSWSGSPVVSGSPGGGVAADIDGNLAVSNVYFDRSSSGVDNAAGEGSISSAFAVDTMTTVSVGAWPSANWNFGDIDAADGAADYPILQTNSADWQKIGLSYGLTRVVAVGAASDTTLRINAANTASDDAFDLLRFDMIGGADFLSAQRHSPDASCSSEADPAGGEILVVAPNFNGAVARVSLIKPVVGARLQTANNGCAFYLESTSDNFNATLRVTYSVGEAVLVADYPLSNYDGASDRSALAGPLVLNSEPPSDPPGQTIVVVPVDATANYSPLTLTAFAASIFTSRESTLFEGAGNDLATIFMREEAVSLFADNNRIYTVSFFAADRRTRTASFTAAFRSAPRVINGGRSVFVLNVGLSRGQTVLAATDVRATIWHLHGAPLRYELDESSTTGGNLFRVDPENGQVELAANLDDGVYRVALVARAMVDGEEFSARQDAQIFIGVTPPPFLYHNLPKGDGSVADPYLVYDAYLLQAIGGEERFPREALTVMASLSALLPDETEQVIADLFGDDAARATASYLLANDIDASIARGWDLEASEARGFSPIGTEATPFRGRFDGGGNRINDLFIRRPATVSAVGLFAQADAAFFANLEIANARVSGGGDTGALVGAVAGAATVTSVWAQGRVESTNEEADRGIGGLIGRYAGELTVARSWFAGEALGGTNVGGLIGLGADGAAVNVQESWTAARVSATVTVAGGLLAKGSGGNLRRSWAVGPVTASSAAGGLVGDGVVAALQGYWDAGVSGQTDSAAGLSVDLRTITDTQIDGAWIFGTDSDFPILDGINVTAQNAAIAAGLTRISVVASVSRTDFQVFEIDVNGDEPNEGGARAPVCAFVDDGVRATTGYNDQVVVVRSTGGGRLTRAIGATDGCRFVIQTDRPQPVLLSVSFGGLFYETIDAGVTRALNGEGLDEFLAAVDWTAVVDGTIYGERDDDNDRILNAYDYSPLGTFDLHYVEDGVITTFADGSPQYPFPIHNIWQLQAISGEDRAPSHLTSGTFAEFFGDAARRVRAHYYLAADIDAASTRGWNPDAVGAPIGFYPLVGFESGGAVIDGRGRIIDGLYINSASEDAGLFARFAGAASNFGIDNARVFAVDGRAGLLAGSIVGGSAASVWGRGRVVGGDDAVALGGLIGALSATPLAPISQSWFAGEVAGGGVVGGLIGSADGGAVEDNWAVARVAGAESAVGGLIGEAGATVRRSWAGGPLAGVGQIGGLVGATLNTAVGEQSYWSIRSSGATASALGIGLETMQTLLATDAGWSVAIWNFGQTVDFPVLAADSIDENRQAVAMSYGLTRLVAGIDEGGGFVREVTLSEDAVYPFTTGNFVYFDLDIDGAGVDDKTECRAVGNGLNASAGFNGVMVRLDGLADGSGIIFSGLGEQYRAPCRIGASFFPRGASTARIVYTAGDFALTANYRVDDFVATVNWAEEIDGTIFALRDNDSDGVLNAYDIAPFGEGGIDLFASGNGFADGSSARPFPIYNIWQLQAIDGVLPPAASSNIADDDAREAARNFYADSSVMRLGASYYLASDIDAAPTRDWDGASGFNPIGDVVNQFTGRFDGRGRLIRDLHIGSSENRAGLFAVVGSDGSILDVGLEDADVSSNGQNGRVGALVGSVMGGLVARGWASSGRTRATGSGGIAGGLVGYLQGGETRESWFVGEVEAGIRSGGLAGVASGALIADSWGLVDVRSNENNANNYAGGLIGIVESSGGTEPSTVSRVWAGGPVSGASSVTVGGLFGEVGGGNQVDGYWAIETSSVNYSAGGASVVSVQTAQTLSVAEWSDAIWSFGDDDDYPILRAHRPGRQEAAIADYLTRVYVQSDGAELVAGGANFYDTSRASLRIDSNGDAPDFGKGGATSVADCSSLRSVALNNGVTLDVTMGGRVNSIDHDQNLCVFGFSSGESANLTVILNFSVAGVSRRREYPILNFPLTVNWTEEIDGTIFALRDDDDDRVLNAYDYQIFGNDGIDLSAGGGESNRPFSIYNIWLLQAIDGRTPPGVVSSGADTMFGDAAARLSASYYLAADIDAAPARDWNHSDDVMGFNPISGSGGNNFGGSFDGRGRVIRDLYIDGGTGCSMKFPAPPFRISAWRMWKCAPPATRARWRHR